MLESINDKSGCTYEKLSKEEQEKRGILGRLTGPIADSSSSTRNGRLYSRELWEKVFDNPIMKEKIANRCCFGELGHPADREEIDIEKVAICLAEKPKVGKDGVLYGVFDILNTPNGRILKSLCDYGCKIGVSSRGTGDVFTNDEGNEEVDPETYECECWDAVVVPAVESARMTLVTESYNGKKSLKEALKESLDEATEDDRKVMEETLKDLGIVLNESQSNNAVSPEKGDINEGLDNKQKEESQNTANNVGDSGMANLISSLRESILRVSELENELVTLKEQLAVSNAKVSELETENSKYKSTVTNLGKTVVESRKRKSEIESLQEELAKKDKALASANSKLSSMMESHKKSIKQSGSLRESISAKEDECKRLEEKLSGQKAQYEARIGSLNEKLATATANATKRLEAVTNKANSYKKMAEKYDRLAHMVADRYIESKATMLGRKPQEIKSRLPENYSLDDVDMVCEQLKSYSLNIGKLPFKLDDRTKVTVKESKNESLRFDNGVDDEIDESLLKLAGLR